MLKVNATVFGEYTHGSKKGHVNPNQSVEFTGVGKTPKDAMKSLGTKVFDKLGKFVQLDMPIYKINSVTPITE